MKRNTSPLIIAVLTIAFILSTGCTSGENPTINPNDAARQILETVEFRDSLVEVEGAAAENAYKLGDDVTEYTIYISGSGATTEEIAVLRVEGGKGEDARSVLQARLDEQKFRYETYLPAQMTKLENPVIISKGDMIIMVIADDPSSAENVIKELFEQ